MVAALRNPNAMEQRKVGHHSLSLSLCLSVSLRPLPLSFFS